MQLGRREPFSLFIPRHRKLAARLIDIFMGLFFFFFTIFNSVFYLLLIIQSFKFKPIILIFRDANF